MRITGVTQAVQKTPPTRKACTKKSKAHKAIEHTGKEFAGERVRPPLRGRVTMQDTATHWIRKIEDAGNISILKKSIVTSTVKHIVPKLLWVEQPSSLESLINLTFNTFINFFNACGYKQEMTNHENFRYGHVMTMRNALENAENLTEEKSFTVYYKDAIAINMRYRSFEDLKSQSLRSVAKHAGEFVTENRPVGFFTRIFQALYRAIFGMAAKYAVKSQFSKINDLASKYYKILSSTDEASKVVVAESEVFAYYILDTLMKGHGEILSKDAEQTGEVDELHEFLMALLTSEQIDQ